MENIDLKNLVKKLAQLDDNQDPIISCYLDLTKSDWKVFLATQLQYARKALPKNQLPQFKESVEKINNYLHNKILDTSQGIAIFCRCGYQPFFESIQFVVPTKPWVSVDPLPSIYNLIEMKDSFHRFVILLTNKESARILEVNLGTVTEAIWTEKPQTRERVGREWTKLHYQNHIKDRTNKYFKEKIKILNDLMIQGEHTHLILAGNPESMNIFKENLPKTLSEKLVDLVKLSDKLELSVIISKTLDSFIEKEKEEAFSVVDDLIQMIATGGLAVGGEDQSMKALYNNQVDMLVIDQDYEDKDSQEEMVKQATAIGAIVETVNNNKKLKQIGGVGCFLRYFLPDQY